MAISLVSIVQETPLGNREGDEKHMRNEDDVGRTNGTSNDPNLEEKYLLK